MSQHSASVSNSVILYSKQRKSKSGCNKCTLPKTLCWGSANITRIENTIWMQWDLLGMLLSELGRNCGNAKPKGAILHWQAWKELGGFGVVCGACWLAWGVLGCSWMLLCILWLWEVLGQCQIRCSAFEVGGGGCWFRAHAKRGGGEQWTRFRGYQATWFCTVHQSA
jgi:hypothetical protein